MIDDEKDQVVDEGAFDLEIEAEPNTDEIMREAVQAVESYQMDEAEDPEAGIEAMSETVEDSEIESPAGSSEAVLQTQLKEAHERTVRALADYENFRRRVDRERRDFARYAAEDALIEFLPVLDNLSRALQAEGDVQDLKNGVEMIHNQVVDVLARLNVLAVPSVGERFDPSVHEAVAKEEDCEVRQPTILEEYQTGYVLHDRLLRPAMVRVAMPQDLPESDEQEVSADDGEKEAGTEDMQ